MDQAPGIGAPADEKPDRDGRAAPDAIALHIDTQVSLQYALWGGCFGEFISSAAPYVPDLLPPAGESPTTGLRGLWGLRRGKREDKRRE